MWHAQRIIIDEPDEKLLQVLITFLEKSEKKSLLIKAKAHSFMELMEKNIWILSKE